MNWEINYNCSTCGQEHVYPLDGCPSCNTPFFWMLESSQPQEPNETQRFIKAMQELAPLESEPEFLTHGGYLWLPSSFWSKDPTGHTLFAFQWLKGIQQYQHDPQESTKLEKNSPAFDVDEALSVLQALSETTVEMLTQPPPIEKPQLQTLPISESSPPPGPKVVNNPEPPGSRRKASDPIEPPSFQKEFIAPLAIFLFFVFLALAYLALHYQKNTRHPNPSLPEVMLHEHHLLS